MQVRIYPFFLWIIGGIFVAVGLSLIARQESAWAGSFCIIIGILLALVLGNITTIFVDKAARTVTIRNRTIFRNIVKEYFIDEIASIEVEHSRGHEGGTTYRVAFITKNGESIPFHSYYTSGYRGKERQAQKLRDFLGLTSTMPPDQVHGTPATSALHPAQEGTTSDVPWRLERSSTGTLDKTHWFSHAFQFSTGFLLIAQIPKATKLFSSSKVPGVVSRFLYEQIVKIYGFSPEATPGLENAIPLEPADPRLEPYFSTLTSDPPSARQTLNPWVVLPLVQWAETHPIQVVQDSGEYGQLVVLFSPQGTHLVCLGARSDEQVKELSSLGVELVKAQGG